MIAEPDVVRLARTIGDPTRIRMLHLLMDGRALTAKELSYGTGVEPATGTAHLQRLLADSLVTARVQGRHKYFRLASPGVAACVEAMMTIAPDGKAAPEGRTPMQEARFCYDHVAGRLAIVLTEALIARKVITSEVGSFALSKKGEKWCESFGIDVEQLQHGRRKFAPHCLDWSERKEHIGGSLGAALAKRFVEEGWMKRERDSRVVHVTRTGIRGLQKQFGIRWK